MPTPYITETKAHPKMSHQSSCAQIVNVSCRPCHASHQLDQLARPVLHRVVSDPGRTAAPFQTFLMPLGAPATCCGGLLDTLVHVIRLTISETLALLLKDFSAPNTEQVRSI